jgi:hypothetical protein
MVTDTKFAFTGRIVRLEPYGFGVVEFDSPIGSQTNSSFGIFSSSQGSLTSTNLRDGARVSGLAEVDHRELASIKVLRVASRS